MIGWALAQAVILAKYMTSRTASRHRPPEIPLKDLIDIFLQPGPVLLRQYEKPNGWLPVILLSVVGTVFVYLYFSKVDPEFFMRTTLERQGEELTKQQADAMAAAGGSSAMMLWPSTIGAALGSVLMMCALALYFLLAGKVTGLAVGFKQGLALAGFSSMPSILASLLGIYGTLSMTPQTFIDALSYTTFDPMLVQLAPESPWKSLAGSFSFLTLWSIGLAALGWKLWSRGGWGAAISIAALPYALIYGFQVVKALMA
jgi:hypothetical protein